MINYIVSCVSRNYFVIKFTVRHNITVVLVWPGPERGCMRMASRRHDIHVCCKLVGLVLLFVFPCSSPQVLRTMVSEEGYM